MAVDDTVAARAERLKSSRALDHLFAPLTIGGMSVANRIMLPGMSAGMMLDEEVRHTGNDRVLHRACPEPPRLDGDRGLRRCAALRWR